MRKKLTIVVTCTDRKTAQPSPDVQLRNLPNVALDARADEWRQRIQGAAHRLPLRSLYKGEAWVQVGELERASERAGFKPHLLVASAGLGLVDVETQAPAYGATFSLRQPDSVGATIHDAQQWWQAMNADDEAFGAALSGPTVLVLSKAYADAIAPTLISILNRPDVLVFGGSTAMPSSARIPADRALSRALGGTATSLNLRMARAWFDLLPASDIAQYRHNRAWSMWTSGARQTDRNERTPLSDDAVQSFVRKIRTEDPSVSRSRALRALRDSGLACEQKRFAGLFDSVLESA